MNNVEAIIFIIYIIPVTIAILARLYWWIMISEKDDTFWPDTNSTVNNDNELCIIGIAFWPLALIILIVAMWAIGLYLMIFWPFKHLRDERLRRTSEK